MIFRKRDEHNRLARKRETRRRRLAHWMSRKPRVETLEDRRLLAVVSAVEDGVPDQFVVRNNANSGVAELFVNGMFGGSDPTTINGSSDSDTLTIDGVNGLPNIDLIYNGAGGALDSLEFINLPAGIESSYSTLPASTPDGKDGLTSVTSGTNSATVQFTGLEPITFVGAGGSLIIDATFTPATSMITVADLAPAGDGVNQVTGDGGFETTTFSGFDSLIIFGGDGTETITLTSLDAADPDAGGPAAPLTHITLNGSNTSGTDTANDIINIQALPATVTATARGGDGNDQINIFSTANSLDNILGPIFANGGEGSLSAGTGFDTLTIADTTTANSTAETVELTGTTISGITGPGGTGSLITYQSLDNDTVDTGRLVINGSGNGNMYNVVSTGNNQQETELNTGGGNDTINIRDGANTANGVVSPIDLNSGGGSVDTLNIFDTAETNDARTFHMNATAIGGGGFNAAVARGGVFGDNGTLFYDSTLEHLDVAGPDGAGINQTYNIDGTGLATGNTVTIDDGMGDSMFNIQGDGLGVGGDMEFNGNIGNDTFQLFFAANTNIATSTNVSINGGGPGSDSENRDQVYIDTTADSAARVLNFTYADAASGDVDITGLGTAAFLAINTTETLVHQGDAGNDDIVTVTGTVADDELAVALRDNDNSALVFRGGTPYVEAPPEAIQPGFLPGVAGGGSGPDIFIRGVSPGAGLTLDGAGNDGALGTGNRAIVYAASENNMLTDGGMLDIFGFGAGVLIPGFGGGNAFDAIDFNSTTPNQVAVVNNAHGSLLPVNIIPASFDQNGPPVSSERPAFIVNGGDEATAQGNGVSDSFTVSPSTLFNIQANGNQPGLVLDAVTGLPIGDQLTLTSPTSINVFADKSSPANVTTMFGANIFGVRDSGMEQVVLNPGTGQLNLLGDNGNAPGTDQTDNFVVLGRDIDNALGLGGDTDGAGEGTLVINGSTPRMFFGVDSLNVFGHELVDTLELTPYANDTPQGWGIDVFYDEGLPNQTDGGQADLLIYNTSAVGGQVSEAITVRPSAPDSGEVVVTNLGFGTPIVDIDYVGNTDIIINDNDGFLNDTDTLTLLGTNPDNPGTSGNETANADFTAAGGVGSQQIIVQDGPAILYAIRNFTGFHSIDFSLLGGNDSLNFTPDTADANNLQNVVINYGGGDPVASDTLTVNANANATVTQGAVSTSGLVDQLGAGDVNYSNVEFVNVNSATAASTLTVRATDDHDTIALAPDNTTTRVWVNDGSVVTANAGSANFSTVTLQGRFGDDSFSIAPSDVAVNVDGGDPVASDTVTVNGSAGQDAVNYTPTGSDAGTVDVTGLGLVTLSTVEHLTYNGQGGDDALTLTATGSVTHTPFDAPDSAQLRAGSSLPLTYRQLGGTGSVTSDASTLTVRGTDSSDTFVVAATTGQITHTLSSGEVRVPLSRDGINSLVIDGFAGDDTVTVAGDHPYSAGVSVNGGQPDSGSDVLNFVGSGTGAVTVDLVAQTITEIGFGAVSYAGYETINVDADAALTVTGGAVDDTINVLPTGGGQDGSFDHTGSIGIALNYTNATTVTFNGGSGTNQLNVLGDAEANTITSAANAITVDGSTVTIGTGFESLHVLGLGGNDDINLNQLVFDGLITISGAGGDDTIVGSPMADRIFGGAGNDVLVGGAGIDFVDGEAGNDTIGGAAIGADDPGNDLLFGGDGSDLFIWEPGDGQDTISGGDDGDDRFDFRGRGLAGDTFTLSANDAHVDAIFNAAKIEVSGVEEIHVIPMDGGAATVTINDLFTTETVTVEVELPTAGMSDSVTVQGRTVADDLEVTSPVAAAVAIAGLAYDVSIHTTATEDTLTLNLNGGDDRVHVADGVQDEIASILNGGDDNDTLTGNFNTANGDAGNDTLIGGVNDQTINGDAGDDIIDARGGTNTVGGGAGADTVLVSGGVADETLDVTHTAGVLTVAGGLSAGINNITAIEHVAVEAGEGSDTINITTLAGGLLDYEVLGGNPIGIVGDTLNVTSSTGVTFMAGPESDSGALVDGFRAIISFDEIEDASVTVSPAGPVTIMGTAADDDITAVGTAANTVDVTVNDGPAITYVGVTSLTLQGKQGDDDITIDVNNAIDVAFVVAGGLPTTGSDQLRITGDDNLNDNPNWQPNAVDGGDFALDSLNIPIAVTGIENLSYDGESDQEHLTISPLGFRTAFTHHPGWTVDTGFMGIREEAGEQLGLSYENLGAAGSVTADGSNSPVASLTALGTLADDDLEITFSGADAIELDLTSAHGDHIDLLSIGVQNYEIQTLDGNDEIVVFGSVLATSLNVLAGSPGGSDSITFIDNNAANDIYGVNPGANSGDGTVNANGIDTNYFGVEHLIFLASGDAGDALTVNDDGADNAWLVDAGAVGDRVQIDGRESVDYSNFNSVDLTNGSGTDSFKLHPTHLTGFNGALTINGDAGPVFDDVITFMGSEAADVVTSGSDTVTLNSVTVTVGNTNFAQLNVATLGGDDIVDLDLTLTGVHKVVDLGAGDDSLDASGMLDGDFFGGIGNDTIVGSPMADRIFGGAGNDVLVGGAGIDFIDGEAGNDTIGGTAIGADDPGNDFLFGGDGSDLFIWEPGDGQDTISGGDDGDDRFDFRGRGLAGDTFTLSANDAHVDAIFNAATIEVSGVEEIHVIPMDGGAATVTINDLFTTETVTVEVELPTVGMSDSVTVEGRTVADDLEVTSPVAAAVAIAGLAYHVSIHTTATEDTLTLNLNGGDDRVHVADGVQDEIASILNGGDDNDTLTGNFNTANGDAGNDTLIGGVNDQTINGDAGDDIIDARGGTNTVGGGAGADTVLVSGGVADETLDVTHTAGVLTVAGGLSAGINNITAIEHVAVEAGEGSDTINITTLAGGLLDYEVLGGNPIGIVGDTLNVTSSTGVTFMAGPESDSGALVDGFRAIISFDEIEDASVTVSPAGPVTIMGTAADDDITAVGTAANTVDVTVNDGPAITYVGVTGLTLQGKQGDDDITIDVNNAIDVAFVVAGGLPTTGSDQLRITGDDNLNDNPNWQPNAVDGGDFALDSLNIPIAVTGIEKLSYDGESDQEHLTISPLGFRTAFTHHPGWTVDTGFMGIREEAGEQLGLSYENLGAAGSVTADGSNSPVASLTALGTLADDDLEITFSGADAIELDLTSAHGDHIDLLSIGVQNYEIQTLDGNDEIVVFGSVLATSLNVLAGSPGGSDVLTFNDNNGADDEYVVSAENQAGNGAVEVNAVTTTYTGIEHLEILASGDAGDVLTVNDDSSDSTWTVDAGPMGDRVQIDQRESIDFSGFSDVDLANASGSDTFNVYVAGLSGFANELTVHSDGDDDVIHIIGSEDDDAFTSDADTVTLAGVNVTAGDTGFAELRVSSLGGVDVIDLDLTLDTVRKVVDAGSGADNVNLSGMQDATVFGGNGNDTIVGSPLADIIFAGPGNDVLIGGGGNDFQYGEDGNDIFGNPSLAADGVADDPGTDFNFGGNGFDNFIWEPGDGADFNSGGDDGADVFRFFGDAADNTFDLRTGGTPTHLNAIFDPAGANVTVDNHGIEDVRLDPLAGNDTINVNDLFQTEVLNVTILTAGGNETVNVAGRTTDDNLNVSGTVSIEGLTYDVNITGSATTDTLTISTVEGDDSITVDTGVEVLITSTVNGGDGDDVLSGSFNTANGDAGDDMIRGGANDQTINGGAGEDTLVGGPGNDTIDGGTEFDTILVQATSADDRIDVRQDSPTQLRHEVGNPGNPSDGILGGAGTETDTLVAASVEQVRIQAGAGDDHIRVAHDDSLVAAGIAANLLRIDVDGGAAGVSDHLTVVDDGIGDTTVQRIGGTAGAGSFTMYAASGGLPSVVYSDVEYASLDPIGPVLGGTGTDGNGRLFVFKHDPLEQNQSLPTATFLGADSSISLDATIDPGIDTGFATAGDEDWYRVVAETTGTLDFQVYFRQQGTLANGRPGLPNDGDLDIAVYDADGLVSGAPLAIAGTGDFGINDANDDERVRIPAVAGQTYYLRVAGSALPGGNAASTSSSINLYNVSIVNSAAPTPFDLELLDNPADGTTNPPATSSNSDTGRSQFDNHTYDSTPTLFLRLDDGIFLHDLPGNPADDSPPDEVIEIPFQAGVTQPNTPGYAIAIFDEGNTLPQTGTAVQTPLGFATAVPGQQGIYTFTVPDGVALSEGSHFLSARVQMIDPANPQMTGFGNRSDSLEIVVDRTPPPIAFGLATVVGDGLHPDSDSGDTAIPATLVDRITNDETPTFFGRGEANSIIRLYVDLDNSVTLNAADLLIGQTVASPQDGTEQLETPANPLEPGGQWQVTSTVNMNDPRILTALGLTKDGARRILLSAEDLAGNITAAGENVTLDIFVDTQGPQVTDVSITGNQSFNLFTLKPDTPEPTPRVDSLTISVQDLPARIAGFLYSAVSNVPPLAPIVLVGDHVGVIPIGNLVYNAVSNGPGVATGEIVLDFDSPLPDDRYTLQVLDNVIDPAGNRLDGENNAAEPIATPFFPSGDLVPGGDFIARFTVDSRPEIATWSQSVVYADINGNFVWDPEGQDNDAVNRDFVYNFGENTDAYFTGNFAQSALPGPDGILGNLDDVPVSADNATSSGFDKMGAYGAVGSNYQFFLDTNDDGVGDFVGSMAFQVHAIPVAGNFFNSAADRNAVANGQRPRDEIGAYDGQNWYLDVNGNNRINPGEKFSVAGIPNGIPLVGDFNGDGNDDLATYNNNSGVISFALVGGYTAAGPTIIGQDQLTFGFSGFSERPVAGDMNLDGVDDIVMWVPGREGQLPKDAGEFHFLVSDNLGQHSPSNVFNAFSPAPLGNDLQAQFGDEFALPLIGNFDPPVASDGGTPVLASLTNELNPLDTTRDGLVTARDALVVINVLSREGLDVSVNPLRLVAALGGYQLDASQDGEITALDALYVINGMARQSREGEQETDQVAWAAAADSAFSDLGDDDEDLIDLLVLAAEQQRIK